MNRPGNSDSEETTVPPDQKTYKRPERCQACGARNPYLINEPDFIWNDAEPEADPLIVERWVCDHRRACEARQMLQAGRPRDEAIRHAQRLDEGVL